MRHLTISVIHEEHQALAAMLRSLMLLVVQARHDHRPPNFEVLRAMLFYIDEFPERQHHPRESELLFPAVLDCCPELAPVIAKLERDHAHGERAVRDLQHALLAFEMMGQSRQSAFEQAAQRYVVGYLEHMAIEESQILPAAQRSFAEEDWARLDAAFATHADPLVGHPPGPDYAPLFRHILMRAPAPVGLGPAAA